MGKVRCLECGEILESKYTHDFVACKCPNQTFVDGGNEYMRMGGKDMDKIEVMIDPTPKLKNIQKPKEVKEERKEEDMLRLTLEMVPKGYESKKYTMAEIEIINRKMRVVPLNAKESVELADYGVRLNGEELGTLVKNFVRSHGAFKLMQEVTAELYKLGKIE